MLASLLAVGCDEDALKKAPADGPAPAGLSPEQAAAPLAKVGHRVITLGDYVAALERMNQFDRLRYQTQERRRQLLKEMIDLELLAQEARRRGLHERAAVKSAIRQVLRDVVLAKSREGIPLPAEIPKADVLAYYEAHQADFQEPERRRASAIVLKSRTKAAEVLADALKITKGKEWGALYQANSIDAPAKPNPKAPDDLAGDLGIVGPPGDPQGASEKVPEQVQAALFTIGDIGEIHAEVVTAAGRFYIVRLAGRSKGHVRSLAEADRSIRVALLQEMLKVRELELEVALRKRFPVTVDEGALKQVKLPAGLQRKDPYWDGGLAGSAAAPKKAAPKKAAPRPPATSAASTSAAPSAAPARP